MLAITRDLGAIDGEIASNELGVRRRGEALPLWMPVRGEPGILLKAVGDVTLVFFFAPLLGLLK